MKRCARCVLTGVMVLAVVSLAAAQAPTPVVRIGDWVEIGNEVFMNFIVQSDIRFRASHNWDFEDDIRDRVASRSPTSSNLNLGEGDFTEVEVRIGG